MPKDKSPIHPIGSCITLRGERLHVFGQYWNGKVDVVNVATSKERVLTLAQQRQARRVSTWSQTPATSQAPTVEVTAEQRGEYEPTLICQAPEIPAA